MSVAIGTESRQKLKNGNWMVKSEICNTGDTAVTVQITSWPYSDDAHDKKIGEDPQEVTKTIPAHECITVAFEFDKEPKATYTDVYPGSGGGPRIDGVIHDLCARSANVGPSSGGSHVYSFPAPYPKGLALAFPGQYKGPFVLEPIVGLPPGWTAEYLRYEAGVPFDIDMNDRENPAAVLVYTGLNPAEGTVADLSIRLQAVNYPGDPLYGITVNLRIVVDTEAPSITMFTATPDPVTKLVEVRGNAFDPAAGIDSLYVNFSTDGGAHWEQALLQPPDGTGAGQNPIQSAEIGPFCPGQEVTAVLVASDQLGNRVESAPLVVRI